MRLASRTIKNSFMSKKIVNYALISIITVLLLAFTLTVIIPFVWMMIMSFKSLNEILLNPYGLPSQFRFTNYVKLMTDPTIKFYRFFYNSVYVTFFSLLISTVLSVLAGYGFGRSRYYFKARGFLFIFILFSLMLPPQILYIPQFRMLVTYGLSDTRWGLILLYGATGLPISTYLMATYFSQLPSEMEDAARIDGCNDWRMFLQVMLPLARPALATIILIGFINNWNELLLSITMVTNPALRTLPAAMMFLVGEHRSEYGLASASLVTAMIPVLILYFFLSERFIEGMTAGALKG